MTITLLGQGFEPISENSIGKKLIKFFGDKDFHTFTGITAFASQTGINGLAKHIEAAKKNLKKISIVTGVDQKGTSKEALEELLSLNIDTYVFFQPSFTIFHPKIYLFEGLEKSELIIGSSNLTSQGLFTNVETSLLISIDNRVEADRQIIEQLKEYFKGIFEFTDPNLKRLNKKIITELVNANIVPNEAERMAAQDKVEKIEKKETETFISKIFPKRAIAKIPSEFRGTKRKTTNSVLEILAGGVTPVEEGDLVWESGKLTERDLNIPKGSNTNPTGSMLFKKGKMKSIDQRHYFRDNVFAGLDWKQDMKPETSHLERAGAFFRIVIEGKYSGTFKLIVTHNPKTDTRSYEQKNSMTQISWGKAKKVIANENLIGKNARLFKTKKSNHFILRIE